LSFVYRWLAFSIDIDTTLTRKGSRAIEVAMILPGKKYEQGDEHECAENKGSELPDSYPLAQSAITNGLKVTIAAEGAQRAKIAGLALHRCRIFIGASIIDAGVHLGAHAQTGALIGAAGG
jgi:hypothetical protein